MMTVIRRELTDVLGRIKTTGNIETAADEEFTGIASQNGKLYVYSKRYKMYTYEQLDTSDAFDDDWNYKLQYPTVLHKMVKLFDADTIRVEATDNNGMEKANTDGGIKIVNGYNSPLEFVTPAFKNEEEMTFTTEEPNEYIEVTPQELLELKSMLPLASKNDMRPKIQTVRFNITNGRLTYYCTDGFRLGTVESKSVGTLPDGVYAIPSKYIKLYLKTFSKKSTGTIKISVKDDNMILQYGKSVTVIHMTEHGKESIDFRSAFDHTTDYIVTVDRKKLIKAVELITKANKTVEATEVIITWKNKTVTIGDLGKVRAKLACESITCRGAMNRVMDCNGEFLLDSLKMFNDNEVNLIFYHSVRNKMSWDAAYAHKMIIETDENKRAVLMAIRLREIDLPNDLEEIGYLTLEERETVEHEMKEKANENLKRIEAEKKAYEEKQQKKETATERPKKEESKQQEEPIKKMMKEKVKIIPVTFAPQEKPKEKPKKRVIVKKKAKVVKAEPKKEEITQQEEKMQPKKVHVEPKKRVVVKKKVKVTAKRKITVKPQPKTEKSEQKQAITKTMDEITDMLVQYALKHEPTREELTAYATEVLATYNVR